MTKAFENNKKKNNQNSVKEVKGSEKMARTLEIENQPF